MEIYLKDFWDNEYEMAAKQMINICRDKQSKHEGDGVRYMQQLLNEGVINMQQYLAMLPAVENYNTPYELNIIEE